MRHTPQLRPLVAGQISPSSLRSWAARVSARDDRWRQLSVAADHVLVLVSADPETSHRTNEAIRIALGIIAGENDVTLVLLGPAAKALGPEIEDYIDGEDIVRHVATLKKLGQRFHVEREAIPVDPDWNADGPSVVPIERDGLAALIAGSDRVLVF